MDVAIEIHDSTLHVIRRRGAALVLELRPAYVHRWDAGDPTATGWNQDVDVVLRDAVPAPGFEALALPCRLSDGVLDADGSRWDGMIPLPFHAEGSIHVDVWGPNDFRLQADASGVELVAVGEPAYVEPSPWNGWTTREP